MAQQTIDIVRETERKAEQTERDAAQQAEQLLQQARKDAEQTVAHMAACLLYTSPSPRDA